MRSQIISHIILKIILLAFGGAMCHNVSRSGEIGVYFLKLSIWQKILKNR